MGNICSRASNDPEAFSSPGRVVGTNPSNQSSAPRASVPAKANWKNTPGRTLGDSSATGPGDSDEARSNAAIAAQQRAENANSASKGKLGSKLAAQKAKTQNQTLNEASETERAARAQDDQRQLAAYQ